MTPSRENGRENGYTLAGGLEKRSEWFSLGGPEGGVAVRGDRREIQSGRWNSATGTYWYVGSSGQVCRVMYAGPRIEQLCCHQATCSGPEGLSTRGTRMEDCR